VSIEQPSAGLLERTRRAVHRSCLVCGRACKCGLGLRFSVRDDGSVEAGFKCKETLQGYENVLHGGVVSTLLDGAMTNCLFAHGIAAVTGEMTVRFRHPVRLHTALRVRARLTRFQPPLYLARAEIIQNGRLMAAAVGKFVERPAVWSASGRPRGPLSSGSGSDS